MKALYINDTGGYESTWPSLTPLATWVTHAPAPQWQIHPFSLGTQGLSTASPWGPNHFLEKWPTLHPGIGGFAFFPFHLQLQGVRRCVWQEEWMYLQHLSQSSSQPLGVGREVSWLCSICYETSGKDRIKLCWLSSPGQKSSLGLLGTERNVTQQPSLVGLLDAPQESEFRGNTSRVLGLLPPWWNSSCTAPEIQLSREETVAVSLNCIKTKQFWWLTQILMYALFSLL